MTDQNQNIPSPYNGTPLTKIEFTKSEYEDVLLFVDVRMPEKELKFTEEFSGGNIKLFKVDDEKYQSTLAEKTLDEFLEKCVWANWDRRKDYQRSSIFPHFAQPDFCECL